MNRLAKLTGSLAGGVCNVVANIALAAAFVAAGTVVLLVVLPFFAVIDGFSKNRGGQNESR